MKSILDPTFRYRPSFATDLEKTFARARRQQRKLARQSPDPGPPRSATVARLVRKTAA